MSDQCPHCGQDIQDDRERPDGCICDPREWEWGVDITPICAKYVGSGVSCCSNCEHDKQCHKESE